MHNHRTSEQMSVCYTPGHGYGIMCLPAVCTACKNALMWVHLLLILQHVHTIPHIVFDKECWFNYTSYKPSHVYTSLSTRP